MGGRGKLSIIHSHWITRAGTVISVVAGLNQGNTVKCKGNQSNLT